MPKKKIEFENNYHKLTELDREEITKQIAEGYTSGHLYNGEYKIYWELNVNVWKG